MIVVGWLISLIALFFYSFAQIDLGLTLTRVSWWQTTQKAFQQIGYFKRPLSTGLYLGILISLFVFYFLILKAIQKRKLGRRQVWRLILLTAGILWLSYNAFSYDLFNYIFDAKIFTFYHQNPYRYRALDFTGDPMLGFMHWTHRYYPYGPVWLALTIPLSFLGFQRLLPTMILFKGLAVASYLGACWLLEKILHQLKAPRPLLGLAIFAFQPLLVIETLVSGHHDLLMMGLVLAAFWFWLKEKRGLAFLMLLLSIGIKFATALLLPVFIWLTWSAYRRASRKINWEQVWLACFGLMMAAVLLAIRRTNLQPWYWLYPFPFLIFLRRRRWLFWPMMALSIGLLLHYAPFFYLGHWNPPVPAIKTNLNIISLSLGLFAAWLF